MTKKIETIPWHDFNSIIFDFDGVFTNNSVYVGEDMKEFVVCNRSDGLGIKMLKNYAKKNNWNLELIILSTEENPVVNARAKKLNIKCFQGISNKYKFICDYLKKNYDENNLSKVIYLGNDLNDLEIINSVGLSIVPQDAHPLVLKLADFVISKNGGDSFVREFVELIINLNKMNLGDIVDLI